MKILVIILFLLFNFNAFGQMFKKSVYMQKIKTCTSVNNKTTVFTVDIYSDSIIFSDYSKYSINKYSSTYTHKYFGHYTLRNDSLQIEYYKSEVSENYYDPRNDSFLAKDSTINFPPSVFFVNKKKLIPLDKPYLIYFKAKVKESINIR